MNKKQFIKVVFPIASLFIVLFILARSNKIDEIKDALQSTNPFFLALAVALVVLSWVSEAHVLYRIGDGEVRFGTALNVVLAGQFFNAITPFATGGQPAQLYMLHKENVSIPKGTTILARKFIIFQSVLVLYSLVVVIAEASFFIKEIPSFAYMGLLGFAVNLFVILMLWLVSYRYRETQTFFVRLSRRLRKVTRRERFRKFYTKFLKNLRKFHQQMEASISRSSWLTLGVTTFIQLSLFFAVPVVISLSLGLTKVEFVHMIAAAAFVSMITSFIPLPGAAFGAEGSFYVFFRIFFPSNTVLTALILWRLITFYLPLAVGWVVVLRSSDKLAE
ncbi:MAG: lysylphosphatidylglycerol synthase transmembrane domain-containing protein [Bacillota bacterium]|nr:lysylphosphatidylglycerol synthase transmembrane domain-containing protein [Bacillota bacterium]